MTSRPTCEELERGAQELEWKSSGHGRLQEALRDIRTLRGIVPICSNCKKIRDDRGYCNQVEQYVSEHSEGEFSHGICPECMKKLHPEYVGTRRSDRGRQGRQEGQAQEPEAAAKQAR